MKNIAVFRSILINVGNSEQNEVIRYSVLPAEERISSENRYITFSNNLG